MICLTLPYQSFRMADAYTNGLGSFLDVVWVVIALGQEYGPHAYQANPDRNYDVTESRQIPITHPSPEFGGPNASPFSLGRPRRYGDVVSIGTCARVFGATSGFSGKPGAPIG